MLRGGAFKPRTSPYSFQGLGKDGLRILSLAREETGLPIVTEAVDRLLTTTESHRRIMVVETMGRHAGWIACFAGIAVAVLAIVAAKALGRRLGARDTVARPNQTLAVT